LLKRLTLEAVAKAEPPTGPGWNYPELADLIRVEALREAAVLVGLVLREDDWYVLLTKRTEQLQSHAGQIAFPGGRRDAHDASAIDTALREAEEEVNIPASQIEVLGYLECFATISNYWRFYRPIFNLSRKSLRLQRFLRCRYRFF
jgi:8-oxo-dGTP pyrophosphatase MutT (NUDIX family)